MFPWLSSAGVYPCCTIIQVGLPFDTFQALGQNASKVHARFFQSKSMTTHLATKAQVQVTFVDQLRQLDRCSRCAFQLYFR